MSTIEIRESDDPLHSTIMEYIYNIKLTLTANNFRKLFTRYVAKVLCEEIEALHFLQRAIPDRVHAWSHITDRKSEVFPQEVCNNFYFSNLKDSNLLLLKHD